jgi:hypothetical protein
MVHVSKCVRSGTEKQMHQIQKVAKLALGVRKGSHNQTCVNCKGIFLKGWVLSKRENLCARGRGKFLD